MAAAQDYLDMWKEGEVYRAIDKYFDAKRFIEGVLGDDYRDLSLSERVYLRELTSVIFKALQSPKPVVDDRVLDFNFTNEGGVGGTTRLLKNIGGLWLVQECRRVWNQAGRNWDWEDLNRLSGAAAPLVSFIDPDAPDFASPGNMPERIRHFCRRTGQTVPEDEGAVLRCALESVAMKFRHVLTMCEKLAGGRLETH